MRARRARSTPVRSVSCSRGPCARRGLTPVRWVRVDSTEHLPRASRGLRPPIRSLGGDTIRPRATVGERRALASASPGAVAVGGHAAPLGALSAAAQLDAPFGLGNGPRGILPMPARRVGYVARGRGLLQLDGIRALRPSSRHASAAYTAHAKSGGVLSSSRTRGAKSGSPPGASCRERRRTLEPAGSSSAPPTAVVTACFRARAGAAGSHEQGSHPRASAAGSCSRGCRQP